VITDLGVAFTWIAISAASLKGLSAFARAMAMGDTEELASFIPDGAWAHTDLHPIDAPPRVLCNCS
jgi:hypothetical protein